MRQGIFPTPRHGVSFGAIWPWLCPEAAAPAGQPLSPAAALSGTSAPSPCSVLPRDGNCPLPCAGSAPALAGPAALPTPLQTIRSLIPLVMLGVSHPCSRVPARQCPLAWGRGTDFSPQSQPLPFEFSLKTRSFLSKLSRAVTMGPLSPEAGARASMSSPATHSQLPCGTPPRTSLPQPARSPGACWLGAHRQGGAASKKHSAPSHATETNSGIMPTVYANLADD